MGSLLFQLWSKLKPIRKLTRIGNSFGIIIPKSIRKSWLNAVELRGGFLKGWEVKTLVEGYKFLDDRRVLIVIPLFADDFKTSVEEGGESES